MTNKGVVNKPVSSRAERPTSFDVADIATPKGREEDWRFTPLKRLGGMLEPENITRTVTGQVQANEKVAIRTILASGRTPLVGAPGDRAAVVAWNGVDSALEVKIPANTVIDTPIYVDFAELGDGAVATHLILNAQTFSKATVVINHKGSGRLNETVEIFVEDGAELTVATLQEWDEAAIYLSNHRAKVARDAFLKHIVVTLGGDLVRLCPEFGFTQPGGRIESLGVYFTDAGQHQEHRTFIDHSQPHCYSRITYKGALQGERAHAVWIGDCLIGKNGDATDTYELNRNLVLTPGAKADSVPNLEIENGEIEGAGHASAIGRFAEDQMFYLQSRGIDPDSARRLVVRGFFAELINQIGVEEIETHLMDAIETELDKAGQ